MPGSVGLPMRVLYEEPRHLIPGLVDGTYSFDELRSPAASQTGGGDHAVADICVDAGHQKCADRAEVPALFLDSCAIGFAFPEFPCGERTRETDLDDTDVLAFATNLMIAVGRGRRRAIVVVGFRQMQA